MHRLQAGQHVAAGHDGHGRPGARKQRAHLALLGGVVQHQDEPASTHQGPVEAGPLLRPGGHRGVVDAQGAQHLAERVARGQRLDGHPAEVEGELAVGEARGQGMGGVQGEGRLAEPRLTADQHHPGVGGPVARGEAGERGQGVLAGGEVGDVARQGEGALAAPAELSGPCDLCDLCVRCGPPVRFGLPVRPGPGLRRRQRIPGRGLGRHPGRPRPDAARAPALGGAVQRVPPRLVQAQGEGQCPYGAALRSARSAALHVPEGAQAHPGGRRELLLGQAGRHPVPGQQAAELARVRVRVCARPGAAPSRHAPPHSVGPASSALLPGPAPGRPCQAEVCPAGGIRRTRPLVNAAAQLSRRVIRGRPLSGGGRTGRNCR